MARIVLIMNQKGGVGKSTLVFNVSQTLSLKYRVAVLDIDPQGSLAQLSTVIKDFEITTDWNLFKRKSEFDIILIDTPPYLSADLKKLVPIANLIIIPTKVGVLDVMAISATINLARSISRNVKMKIVLNMVKPNTSLTKDVIKKLKSFEVSLSKILIGDLVDITRSFLVKGVQRNDKARFQFYMLANMILEQVDLQKI